MQPYIKRIHDTYMGANFRLWAQVALRPLMQAPVLISVLMLCQIMSHLQMHWLHNTSNMSNMGLVNPNPICADEWQRHP